MGLAVIFSTGWRCLGSCFTELWDRWVYEEDFLETGYVGEALELISIIADLPGHAGHGAQRPRRRVGQRRREVHERRRAMPVLGGM